MNPHDFAQSLVRLSHGKPGLQEATILFLIATGFDSNKALAGSAEIAPSIVYSRVQALRKKGLIQSRYDDRGNLTHSLTTRGHKLVTTVIP